MRGFICEVVEERGLRVVALKRPRVFEAVWPNFRDVTFCRHQSGRQRSKMRVSKPVFVLYLALYHRVLLYLSSEPASWLSSVRRQHPSDLRLSSAAASATRVIACLISSTTTPLNHPIRPFQSARNISLRCFKRFLEASTLHFLLKNSGSARGSRSASRSAAL